MENKKYFWINIVAAGLTVLIATALIIAACIFGGRQSTTDEAFEPSGKYDTKISKSNAVSVYVLREHNGIIGIFDRSGALLDTVGVNTVTLPQNDRERLAEGIVVEGDNALAQALQDFSD